MRQKLSNRELTDTILAIDAIEYENGSFPTFKEIGERLNLSTTAVKHRLERLREKGVLVAKSDRYRGYRFSMLGCPELTAVCQIHTKESK
jgi:biotin operon repressor